MRFLWLGVLLCVCAFNYSVAANRTPMEMAYFLDTHTNLTLEDLQNNPIDTHFSITNDPVLAVGFSRYPLWLKLQLPLDNNFNMLKIDSFLLNEIDLYQQSANQSLQHLHISHPQLLSNRLTLTPNVDSTVWIRITSNSAIHLSTSLISSTAVENKTMNDFGLLVFAITFSMGLIGVILHTQSKQQRLSLLSLQGLLLALSGLSLPIINALGYSTHALTAALLLTFLLHVSHFAQEQPWWHVRNLRILRGAVVLLLLANFWPTAPINSSLLLLFGVLSYALWAPFAHIHMTRATLKSSLQMIAADLLFWLICLGIALLHTGWWPYPQRSEMIWNISILLLSLSLLILQLRAFIREHRQILSLSTDATTHEREVFKNLAPQPIIANSTLLPRVKSGMRHEDNHERLHDHLSVIQQETPTQHVVVQEHTQNLQSQNFNLRVVGHELLQELEALAYPQQTPILFAIKPGTHTHLIGSADGLMTLLQQLTRHSLQQTPQRALQKESLKNISAISVRIEDEGVIDTENHEHHYPVLLKSHLRDSSCLNEEQIHLLNQPLKNFTDDQYAQLQQDHPQLFAAKKLVEKLHGQLHIHAEGAATTCYTLTLPMQSAQAHQPEPPKSFLTLKDKKILLMTYDGEYGMTMAEQASGQDIPLNLALSISQARRNLQYSHQTDAQFDLLVFDCSNAEETLHAFISEIHSTLPGYMNTPLLLLHHLTETLPQDEPYKHASKPSAFAQLGALITSLLSSPTFFR